MSNTPCALYVELIAIKIIREDNTDIGTLYSKYIQPDIQLLESRFFNGWVAFGRQLGMLANGGK